METTPCGLLKFNEVDTYNFSDAVSNFKRPDELLAQLGAHSSRIFDHSGTDKLATIGAIVDSRWNVTAFDIVGKGEWFFIYVAFTPKTDQPKSGSKTVIQLPAFYSAMHTQKLASMANGRGAGGWISQTGQVQLGTTSGSDSTLKAGETLQLCGWYLPKNDLKTVGIPTVGEKSPFFSNYLASLSVIDKACKDVNANLTSFKGGDQTCVIKGNDAWLSDNSEKCFTVNSSNFSLNGMRYAQYGDFAFIAISVKSKSVISIPTSGDIGNMLLGTIIPNRFFGEPLRPSPLENDNFGRLNFSYINTGGTVSVAAIGRAGGTGTITAPVGEDIGVAGYYRLIGT